MSIPWETTNYLRIMKPLTTRIRTIKAEMAIPTIASGWSRIPGLWPKEKSM